ncbi:MAG: hypothetical protein PVI01_12610 [Gemmatimonadales bacterium]|jgi:hypothetical protein
MTNRSQIPELRVRTLWKTVVAWLAVAALAGLLGVGSGLLLAGWIMHGTSVWQRPSAGPLLLWVFSGGVAAVWLGLVARRWLGWTRRRAAAEIEQRVGLPAGSLQGGVESDVLAPGTSTALLELHRLWLADRLQERSVARLGAERTHRARSYAAFALVVGGVTFSSLAGLWIGARPAAAEAWAAVFHPFRHLSAPPLPALHLTVVDRQVRRGHDLSVFVLAPARDSVRLNWQPVGLVSAGRWLPVRGGRASGIVPRIESPTRVWVSAADGAVSDTLELKPVDPLLLLDAQLTLDFPPHTRRESELLSPPWPRLAVPAGTRATLAGSLSLPVSRVTLRDSANREVPIGVVEGRRFRGSFSVRTGSWGWDVVGAGGEALEGDPDSLHFATVRDSAPSVAIVFPGTDTLLGPRMTQQLVVEAADDYGVARMELVSWRVSILGERWPEAVEPIAVSDSSPRATVTPVIDARGRGLLPGDTLRYYVRAYDAAPQANEGRSREYALRLATLSEVREQVIADARGLVGSAEELAEKAAENQEATRALERSAQTQQSPGVDMRPGRDASAVEFRDTESAREALDQAGQLLEDAETIEQSLRELQEGIEQAGLSDPSVMERLRELESLYERIMTPELEALIENLREALVELDSQQLQEAIRELARGSRDFRERVEQSLQLLRRAALEAEFQLLGAEAGELSAAHEDLANAIEDAGGRPGDSVATGLERQASELSDQAEDLKEKIGDLIAELERAGEPGAQQQAQTAAGAMGEAARSDRQAAEALRGQRAAGKAARDAASRMKEAAAALQRGRDEMQQRWRQQVVEALERATSEALELAQRQGGVNQQLGSSDPVRNGEARSEEVALKRGVDQLTTRLESTARGTLLLDPSLLRASAAVGEVMDELLGQMGDGTRAAGGDPRLGGRVSEALNELAYRLMLATDAASMAQSGTGMQEALEQLAQLAEQQGELNAQATGIDATDMSALIMQRLRELAQRQRAVARELEDLNRSLGPKGQVLGELDAMSREAEDLARELERGRLDERLVERQNRLFQRLLDAGRTLERDEFDKERRAERPEGVEVLRPGALPEDVLRGAEFPLPNEEALRQYPPAFRRLILEYFDRLNQRDGSGGN